MIEKNTIIKTEYGEMEAFVKHPDEGGPFPLVIFLMDAPGMRSELHFMARRLTVSGYYVVLPNLYYRTDPDFVLDFAGLNETSIDKMFEHMNSLTNAMVCSDIANILDYAEHDCKANSKVCGTIGYCMSGPFAFAAIAKFPSVIKAAASLHGVRLYTDKDDSPHLDAERIKGEMYFGCAEFDEHAPQEMIDKLDTYLSKIDVNYRIEIYPKTDHGFVFPDRLAKYNHNAAETHWARILSLFERNIKL
ncbi:MAG: hydrolase [Aestuariivita sp.]|nr:hydrolase [Aestuariivita sp.]